MTNETQPDKQRQQLPEEEREAATLKGHSERVAIERPAEEPCKDPEPGNLWYQASDLANSAATAIQGAMCHAREVAANATRKVQDRANAYAHKHPSHSHEQDSPSQDVGAKASDTTQVLKPDFAD